MIPNWLSHRIVLAVNGELVPATLLLGNEAGWWRITGEAIAQSGVVAGILGAVIIAREIQAGRAAQDEVEARRIWDRAALAEFGK